MNYISRSYTKYLHILNDQGLLQIMYIYKTLVYILLNDKSVKRSPGLQNRIHTFKHSSQRSSLKKQESCSKTFYLNPNDLVSLQK